MSEMIDDAEIEFKTTVFLPTESSELIKLFNKVTDDEMMQLDNVDVRISWDGQSLVLELEDGFEIVLISGSADGRNAAKFIRDMESILSQVKEDMGILGLE